MILLFVQQKRKHSKVVFLTSRSVSKHVLFALGVDPTARDAGEGGGSDLVSQGTIDGLTILGLKVSFIGSFRGLGGYCRKVLQHP